jgi:hypothetical protein
MAKTKRSKGKTFMQGLLDELIDKAPKLEQRYGGMKILLYVAMCTPELAQKFIEHSNFGNRRVRQGKVTEYANCMKRGDWLPIGTVEIFDSGRVHDGQHRLLACVEAGVPIPMVVQVLEESISSKVSQYKDIGPPRTLPDYLKYNHVPDSERTARLLRYERNFRITGSPFQNCPAERIAFLKLYKEIGADAVKNTFDIVPRRMCRAMKVSRQWVDWFAYQVYLVDPEGAALFLSYTHEPENLGKDDPMYVLHNRLVELATNKDKSVSVSTVEQGAIVIKAWNLYFEQRPARPSLLRYRVNEGWPEIKGSHAVQKT